MKPACQSWKPNMLTLYRLSARMLFAKTLYGMFSREISWINVRRRQTWQLASAVLVVLVQQSQMDSPATQLRGDTSPLVPTLSHHLVPLFLGCGWVFPHTVKGTAAHSFSQHFWGAPPLQSHSRGKRGWMQKRVFQVNPPDRDGNQLPSWDLGIRLLQELWSLFQASWLKIAANWLQLKPEPCSATWVDGRHPTWLILARMLFGFLHISHLNESKWK